MNIKELNQLLGNIDIYLLDQVLKGRFDHQMRILDAGCGEGRNIIYFLQEGYQVFGLDENPLAVKMARAYVKTLQPGYDPLRIQVAKVEDMPFHNGAFQAIISSAVLHFARDEDHFRAQFSEMMRVLDRDGILFLRMTVENKEVEAKPLREGRFLLPDGSERFVLADSLLEELMKEHALALIEPYKKVVVHQQRAMGTLVLKKV